MMVLSPGVGSSQVRRGRPPRAAEALHPSGTGGKHPVTARECAWSPGGLTPELEKLGVTARPRCDSESGGSPPRNLGHHSSIRKRRGIRQVAHRIRSCRLSNPRPLRRLGSLAPCVSWEPESGASPLFSACSALALRHQRLRPRRTRCSPARPAHPRFAPSARGAATSMSRSASRVARSSVRVDPAPTLA